jgi:hypothetical protein
MASYGWTEYDGRLGGKQIIKDRGMKLDLETEFIKVPAQNGLTALTKIRGRIDCRWELGCENKRTTTKSGECD